MFVKIKVFPRSRKQEIIKLENKSQEKFEIKVRSPAQNNAANREALEIIASFFKISQKNVKIISGHRRSNKMLEIIKE